MEPNDRQKDLILSWLNREYPSIDEMVEKNKISKRTAYNDIAAIKVWAAENKLAFSIEDGQGFSFSDTGQHGQIKELLTKITPYATPLNQHTRSNIILAYLLFNQQDIKISTLCETLGFSRSTFYRDINFVQLWLSKFNVKLDIIKQRGMALVGNERKIREAAVFFIKQNFNQYDLVSLIQNESFFELSTEKSYIFDLLCRRFQSVDIKNVNHSVSQIETRQAYSFLDNHRYFLVWIICISLARIESGHRVTEINTVYLCQYLPEYELLKELLEPFFSALNAPVPKAELYFLSFHLKSIRNKHVKNATDNPELDLKILRLVENVSIKAGKSFIGDVELMESLNFHIQATLERIDNGIEEINPLKNNIIESYGDLFDICSDELEALAFFPKKASQDEVAYIAIYFAAALERLTQFAARVYAVCTTGKGSAQLLLVNLKNKFSSLNVKGTVSVERATKLNLSEADAIISTAYFENAFIPVVVVNPLILKDDVAKIKKALQTEVNDITPSNKFTNSDVSAQEPFLSYMYALSDCATATQELAEVLGVTLDNGKYIGIIIHLMMQIGQPNVIGDAAVCVSENDSLIVETLNKLYKKYNKKTSGYDLNSVKIYFQNHSQK